MNGDQRSQPKISEEEVCKEITRETISLIGDVSNAISGNLSIILGYVMAVLTAVVVYLMVHSEVLKYVNIPEEVRVPIYIVFMLIFTIIAIFITRSMMIEYGSRHAKIVYDALIKVLYCRERFLRNCQWKLCKSEPQGQYCIDVSVVLASIEKIKSLLKKDYSNLCKTMREDLEHHLY